MTPTEQRLSLEVGWVASLAEGIKAFELRRGDSSPLPPFTAGAHVDIELPQNVVRSYSLMNSQAEREHYVIAVHEAPQSRGGSRYLHEVVKPGHRLAVSAPRNNFPLVEDGPHSVLIGGGIGITPLWSMLQRLRDLGRGRDLFFSARTRRRAALLNEMEALEHPPTLWFDDEHNGDVLDLDRIVRTSPAGSHFYCCGPLPMLESFKQATRSLGPERVHVEYFSADVASQASAGFTVVLKRSGIEVRVPPNTSIIDALQARGIEVNHSCREGICGACETAVLEGVPEHRDLILGERERASNRTMMICCSVAKTDRLVLDL